MKSLNHHFKLERTECFDCLNAKNGSGDEAIKTKAIFPK